MNYGGSKSRHTVFDHGVLD